jgi:hypothetical protein
MTSGTERIAQLNAGIDNLVTSLTLKFDAPNIAEGAILGIDLEELYVVAKSGLTVTVIRGFNSSIAASHDADQVVRINPKFSDYRLGKYVNEALDDLSGDGLFWIDSLEFSFSPSTAAYNLNAPNLIDIWRVRYAYPGNNQHWQDIPKCDWLADLAANTTDFPNGKSLLLIKGGVASHLVRVSFKSAFTPLTLITDDVLTISKLHREAHKMLGVGAAINALGGREIKRTFIDRQPEPRRAQEVPAGAANQAMLPLIRMYQSDLRRERRRLRRRYPDQVY